MKQNEGIEIKVFPTVLITLTGPYKSKEEQKLRLIELKNSAQKYGGIVISESDGADGYSVEVKFSDKNLMNVWRNSIKLH